MKRVYVKPSIEDLRIDATISLLESSGEITTEFAEGKENQQFEEEETGIPTAFANIWGDEEEKED